MSRARGLRAEARRRGVLPEYVDAGGRRRVVSDRSLEAVLASLRPARGDDPLFARPRGPVPEGLELVLVEGGGEARPRGPRLPGELAPGYHRAVMADGAVRPLVVSPGACHLPRDGRAWGWAVQLYACRSRRSWGIGDAGDLRRLAGWGSRLGAGLLLLNPLGAAAPVARQQPSPYYPSSRRFRNPLYIDVDAVPAVEDLPGIEALRARGRALNRAPLLDRDAAYRAKTRVLELAWRRFPGHRDFDRFRDAGGEALRDFAVFCALCERHGANWRAWPPGLRHPRGRPVERYAAHARRRVEFHMWLQWLLERQLRRAARVLPLVHDLAVGFDPDGADAWAFQDLLAPGVRIGAPPDDFNLDGQDWGLPPFDPGSLRGVTYRPLAETLRAAMEHGGGVRVDHVLGFFRTWWVPAGLSPAEGAYVRYPAAEMLDILALESHRAGAVVVGEDLGTVEPGVRQELARRAVLGCRLLWFEDSPPRSWPRRSMGAVTTHDLPTVAGVWTGADLLDQAAAGKRADPEVARGLRERLRRATRLETGATAAEAVGRAYEALAAAPSHLLVATLEDACQGEAQTNMPGTTDSWPNWRIPLPLALEELTRAALPRRIARALARPPRSS